MSLKFFDCVGNSSFENYWYFNGLSEKLGCNRFKLLASKDKIPKIEKDLNSKSTWLGTVITVIKIFSLFTIIILLCMLAGKANYRSNHSFEVSNKREKAKGTSFENDERIRTGTQNVLFPQKLDNTGQPVKFSTNIGFSMKEGKLYENSDFRVQIIAQNILQANLDIVCVQEMTDDMEQKFKGTGLKDKFKLIWKKHPKNNHGVGIFYDKTKFQLLHENVLDMTVNVKTSFPKPRTHVLLDLIDNTTQKVFRVVSCHMSDPRDNIDKEQQTNAVIDFAEKYPEGYEIDRIIIAGDMNQDEFGDIESPPRGVEPSENLATSFRPFISKNYKIDGNLESTEYTKENPGNDPILDKGRHIDWIWVKDHHPEHIDLSDFFDNRGSDHALVASVIY